MKDRQGNCKRYTLTRKFNILYDGWHQIYFIIDYFLCNIRVISEIDIYGFISCKSTQNESLFTWWSFEPETLFPWDTCCSNCGFEHRRLWILACQVDSTCRWRLLRSWLAQLFMWEAFRWVILWAASTWRQIATRGHSSCPLQTLIQFLVPLNLIFFAHCHLFLRRNAANWLELILWRRMLTTLLCCSSHIWHKLLETSTLCNNRLGVLPVVIAARRLARCLNSLHEACHSAWLGWPNRFMIIKRAELLLF